MNKNSIVNRRITIYSIIVCLIFFIIICRLFFVMIINNKKYKSKIKKLSYSIVEKDSGPRGRIYDRNYNIIVDNIAVRSIYYRSDNKLSLEEEFKLLEEVSSHIELDLDKLNDDMKKNYYINKYKDKDDLLISKDELKLFEERKLSYKDIINLKMKRISKEVLDGFSDLDNKVSYLYYLINNGYTYSDKVIKSGGVTDSEYAYITENKDKVSGFYIKEEWERTYPYGDVFKSILGSVSTSSQGIPSEYKNEYLKKGYSLDDRVGLSYIEKEYDEVLRGSKNVYKVLNSHQLELIKEARRGQDIVLSIDINLQKELEEVIASEIIKAKNEPNTKYYNHSFVVIQDPRNGEILAMAGKKVENENGEYKVVDYTPAILTSPMTPGSVVKAASMLVGYNTGAIKMGEVIKDECIKIASTPKKCSWRTYGYINDIEALAFSSNVYQFKTAIRVAGSNYQYNMPFKINNNAFQIYRKMYNSFGLGVKTGIDLPVESKGYSSSDETPGLLLDYVMGQFETYTAIQLSQYISTIANGGERLKPHILKEIRKSSENDEIGDKVKDVSKVVLNKIDSEEKYFDRVKEGLHAVTMSSYGLGRGFINYSHDPSGKTGTSQSFLDTNNDGVIDTETISTLFIAYAPTDNPTVSFLVASPNSSYPNEYNSYSSLVNYHLTQKISELYFKFYN